LTQTTEWHESADADLESEIEGLEAAHITERDALVQEHQIAQAHAAEHTEEAQAIHMQQIEDTEKLRVELSQLQGKYAQSEQLRRQIEQEATALTVDAQSKQLEVDSLRTHWGPAAHIDIGARQVDGKPQ
jgi:hypothetical protein